MPDQLIPAELLKKSNKILFVAHLALGDFTYMQNCFRAFAAAFPHLKIHLWVDEVRRTKDAAQWPHLSKYVLYDWVKSCSCFEKIYDQTYSPQLYKQSIAEAQREEYPIVVSFAVLRRHLYAELVRKLSPNGYVVAQKKRVRLLDIRKHLAYRKLDAHIPAYASAEQHGNHISAIYAGWFEQLFGIQIPVEQRFPFVDIPPQWLERAQHDLTQQGVPPDAKLVFLNAFSKSEERSWPLEWMLELSQRMRATEAWRDAHFIVNVVPEKMAAARKLFDSRAWAGVHLFSAEENFFQLPAVLSRCSLIISVETAVMHLANAVHVPVIALMRQTSPEWTPIDAANSKIITVRNRKAWVKEISVDDVMQAL
ncbi:glycosyltransferase family 9 protein [Herbaspirillum lusitanum]|uniref:Glycosyltransferase family 9 protein n=1 Tax=Herbaspirillum lusitanum TaxID=213312 RepID=A0ABW9A2A7_9BURK